MAITVTRSTFIAKIGPICRRISHFCQGCSLVSAGARSVQFCPSLGLLCRWMNSSALPAGVKAQVAAVEQAIVDATQNVEDPVVVVTSASRGIGKAIALALGEAGCKKAKIDHCLRPPPTAMKPLPPPKNKKRFWVMRHSHARPSCDTTKLSCPSLDKVEEILGYTFKNKKLLEEAYTHGSFQKEKNEFSYERLKFMGGSVLSLLITKEQFFLYSDLQPGPLTWLRSANVDTEKLARVTLKHGLHRFLRHNKPKIQQQIHKFGEAVKEYPLHSNGQIEVPKVLADVIESTIGAVFVDCNCSADTVWEVFKELLEPMIVPKTLKIHPVTELNERCQKRGLKLEFKDSWKIRGSVDSYIEGYFAGRGECPLRKDIALNRAAKAALNNIDKILQHIENTTLMMNLRTRWRAGLKYAQYGDISPKVDVYAFRVVLYELISAKEAVVKENGSVAESKGLCALKAKIGPCLPPPPTTMEPLPPLEKDGATESCVESSCETTQLSFPSLDRVEEILGYTFKNKNLLEEAYTYGSFAKEKNAFSYERLEFMGDSVLSLLITKEQFFLHSDLQPGPLTQLRSANIDQEKLARVALKHGLHQFLRHNEPNIQQQIHKFGEAVKEYPLHSNGQIEVPKILADVIESTIGAVFVDCSCSVDTVWVVFKELLEPMIVPETLKIHPVAELNERCQQRGLKLEFKDSWKIRGSVDFYIEGYFAGRGELPLRKDIALNRAAKAALNNIDKILKHIENTTLMMKLKTRWRAGLEYVSWNHFR